MAVDVVATGIQLACDGSALLEAAAWEHVLKGVASPLMADGAVRRPPPRSPKAGCGVRAVNGRGPNRPPGSI
jgi:hypothetical protein